MSIYNGRKHLLRIDSGITSHYLQEDTGRDHWVSLNYNPLERGAGTEGAGAGTEKQTG